MNKEKRLKQPIKGIIFDYGATIDSNGTHWAEVIWQGYERVDFPIDKANFRQAYVYAERTLATHPYIQPSHTFRDLLRIKIEIQQNYIQEHQLQTAVVSSDIAEQIVAFCYGFALGSIERARPVLIQLAEKYKLLLVSNFYGNIESVLADFNLLSFFSNIIESAVVGIRKPDPRIFALGVEKMGFLPTEIVVVGDSYQKDIAPAVSLGCQTIWIKGKGWDEAEDQISHDFTLSDFTQLTSLL